MRWRSDPTDPAKLADHVDHAPAHDVPVEDYWALLRPQLDRFGITRVADITGLDHIGYPVVQAVRPAARSNAVTQGKSATLEGAAVGAVLECLEMAAGEDAERLRVMRPDDRSIWRPLAPGADWPTDETPFVAALDIGKCTLQAIPRDLISTDFARGAPAEEAPILRNSIGLGAGASPGIAMMHGLLECIEADARIRAEHGGHGPRVALDECNKGYGGLLRRVASAGLRTAVLDISRSERPCVVAASVMEPPGASALPLPAAGFAARADAGSAIAAALAEALQARLAAVSGAREDITRRFYDHRVDAETLAAEWARHGPAPAAPPRANGGTPPSLRQLAQEVGPVLAVPLHCDPAFPLFIVRIVAPNLIADPLRLGAVS